MQRPAEPSVSHTYYTVKLNQPVPEELTCLWVKPVIPEPSPGRMKVLQGGHTVQLQLCDI